LVLTIVPAGAGGGLFEISWPAAAGPGVLEATATPGNPASWDADGLTTVLAGDRHVATVSAEGTQRFFRVRQ
jgi:hypothetical protein